VRPERAPEVLWVPLSEQSLAAAQAQSRPVLVDFQAAWCLPCRKMERTTFVDPAFVETARSFSLLKADVTEQDEIAEALMERFTVVGVPTYVLLAPDGRELRRFESYVDADDMVAAMRAALDASRG
jgi:thiol:disulfide interchange protein DsbD